MRVSALSERPVDGQQGKGKWRWKLTADPRGRPLQSKPKNGALADVNWPIFKKFFTTTTRKQINWFQPAPTRLQQGCGKATARLRWGSDHFRNLVDVSNWFWFDSDGCLMKASWAGGCQPLSVNSDAATEVAEADSIRKLFIVNAPWHASRHVSCIHSPSLQFIIGFVPQSQVSGRIPTSTSTSHSSPFCLRFHKRPLNHIKPDRIRSSSSAADQQPIQCGFLPVDNQRRKHAIIASSQHPSISSFLHFWASNTNSAFNQQTKISKVP